MGDPFDVFESCDALATNRHGMIRFHLTSWEWKEIDVLECIAMAKASAF